MANPTSKMANPTRKMANPISKMTNPTSKMANIENCMANVRQMHGKRVYNGDVATPVRVRDLPIRVRDLPFRVRGFRCFLTRARLPWPRFLAVRVPWFCFAFATLPCVGVRLSLVCHDDKNNDSEYDHNSKANDTYDNTDDNNDNLHIYIYI